MPQAKKASRMLSARVSPQLLNKVKRRALDEETSVQAIVVAAVEDYLRKPKA